MQVEGPRCITVSNSPSKETPAHRATELTGHSITVYEQHEVIKDLVAHA